ncbi:MAG: alkaline phosphatase [Bacteroidales bacterium]|nr:alkaline phosphatase [Bacteroidales bacterium]
MKNTIINTRLGLTVLLLVTGFVISSCSAGQFNKTISTEGRAKNVILLIGDGMGITQVSGAMTVSGDKLNMTTTKHIGFAKTQSYDNYVTDSAAGGTAIASGKKTRNGMLGMSPDSTNVEPITEFLRRKEKMSYGMVSTSAVTHATPASFVAHNIDRNNYEDIALDYVRNQPDVFIGGGKSHFINRRDQRDLVKVLENDGYEVVFNMEDLKQVKGDKVAGLLADVHMPRYSDGRDYMLAEATSVAIEVLSRNENGFFLMVEGSQIDWGGHDNDPRYALEETYDFDLAVGVALQFAAQDENTLVIVTADHETGGMALPGGDLEDRSVIADFTTNGHTGVVVPVFSFGPGAENFTGFFDNTEYYGKIKEALRARKERIIQ